MLKNKTVAITGSTGGLGKEICFYLAEIGANLILLDRNRQKSENLKSELLKRFKDIKITLITTELQDIISVKNATEQLKKLNPDFFLHNAGAYSIPREVCSTGYDNVFQINFVSPYYIIRELIKNNPDIKILAVGSIAHNYSKIDINDIGFKTRKSSALVYGNSKRFLMFSLFDLFKENEQNLSIVHPGITFTNITAHYPKLIFAVIKHPMKLIFMKPKKAALCILEGFFTFTPYNTWIGPKIFNIWGKPKKQKLKTCKESEIKQISDIAERI